VLNVAADPEVTGVLVAELLPYSPAPGLVPGDIITAYDGHRVGDLDALTDALANVAAHRQLGDAGTEAVALTLRRAGRNLTLSVPAGGLGITPLSVVAGTPLPLNPPATPRVRMHLDWAALPAPDADGDPVVVARFVIQRYGIRIGMQRVTVSVRGARWQVRAATDDRASGRTSTVEAEVEPGDGRTAPAVLTYRADRPVQAVPQCVLPLLAAALPTGAGTVLNVALCSDEDQQVRPGYALVALGRQDYTLPDDEHVHSAQAVALMFFRQTRATFYLDDQRQVLAIAYPDALWFLRQTSSATRPGRQE
jgi:hypothetical protein